MSTIKETTLHPDNDPNVDLYPRTLATLVEGLDVAITTKAPRPVACKIVLPKGATNGNLTEEQLTILSASPQNYIEMVNDKELYYLNDPGHESGFYTYSHVGIENSKATIKTLTITVSAKSFVIVTTVVPTDSGGGKLYSYKYAGALSQSGSHGMPTVYVYFQFYLPYLIEINTYEKFRSICEKVYGKDTYIPVTFHRIDLDAYYSGAFRFYKSSADNYVRFFFCGITSDSSDTNPAIFAYYTDANALIPPAANDVNKQWSDVVNLTVTEV